MQVEIDKLPKENIGKSAKNKLKEFNNQLDKVKSDIKKYSEVLEKYGDQLILNAHMIIEYADKAWVLYAGNENILTETYANYYTYLTHLEYCKNKGYRVYDQFGTIGDLRKIIPYGIAWIQEKFGGDYVEFLGEFDYVTNPLMYFVFTKMVPLYRKIVRKNQRRWLKMKLIEVSKEEFKNLADKVNKLHFTKQWNGLI